MRVTGLIILLISTTVRADGELEPDDLPDPKPEVITDEPTVDPPRVPTFELPGVEAGFRGVRELRVHSRLLLGTEVRVKGYVTSIYDCAAVLAIAHPHANRGELLQSIDNDPRQCERPRFYLADARGASREASIPVVDVPRRPAKPEREAMSASELAKWPEVPRFAVGDYVIITGTWSTRSPHDERDSNGLLVYKALAPSAPAATPPRTAASSRDDATSEPEIAVVTKAPLRHVVDMTTRNASVDDLNACNRANAAQQYDAGIALCEAAAKRWDGNHLAWYGVASAHVARGEWRRASAAAERAVTLRPDQAMYQLYYGIALYESERDRVRDERAPADRRPDEIVIAPSTSKLDAARDALRRAAKLGPGLWRAHYYLGCVYRDLDDARRAAEQFTQVIATHPTYRPAYLALIELYLRWQYVEQALAVATIGVHSVASRDAGDLWFAAGMVYDEMRADDAAIGAFSATLTTRPGDTRSKFQRGQAYLRKGDVVRARRDLEDVVKSADPQLLEEKATAAQLLSQLARKPRRGDLKSPGCRLHGECLVDDDVIGPR